MAVFFKVRHPLEYPEHEKLKLVAVQSQVCAWCQQENPLLEASVRLRESVGVKVTHGICEQHQAQLLKDFYERRNANHTASV